jgi:hypothetical protein
LRRDDVLALALAIDQFFDAFAITVFVVADRKVRRRHGTNQFFGQAKVFGRDVGIAADA